MIIDSQWKSVSSYLSCKVIPHTGKTVIIPTIMGENMEAIETIKGI
jgi:hypothetical protein